MITGKTMLIAHLGYPTEAFKAPMIYNPWFAKSGVDAVVVPMGVQTADYPGVLASLARITNLRGALVTMPHKLATLALVAEASPAAQIAGACNALLKRADGSWLGDQFDGTGFVRGVERKGRRLAGACLRRRGDRRFARRDLVMRSSNAATGAGWMFAMLLSACAVHEHELTPLGKDAQGGTGGTGSGVGGASGGDQGGAAGTASGAAGTAQGGAAGTGMRTGPFKILVMSTALEFPHDSIPTCLKMLQDLG